MAAETLRSAAGRVQGSLYPWAPMQAVPALVHRLLGLLHPEWGLRLGPAGPGRRRRGSSGVILEEETRTGAIDGGTPVESAMRCCYDGATLKAPHLVGRCELSRLREAVLQRPVLDPGARVVGCDLSGVRWTGGTAAEAELSTCALPHAAISGVELGSLTLCDLSHARLDRVHLARAVACDLTGAVLVDCDLAGADLRGSRLRGARFEGGSLQGARVEGTDFRGVQGLDAPTRRRLAEDGGLFAGPRSTTWARRLAPGRPPLTQQGLARGLTLGGWVALVALGAGSLAVSLRPPPVAAEAAPPPARERIPTEEEKNRTRIALRDARSALSAAHEAMVANGATNRSWPTIVEFQENHYDLDGDGPGEVMERLFKGGQPGNFLTDSEGGVLPYCNETPDQATLSGVDTDWHYCEQTGRVFAGAGFSGQATLNW